MKRFHVEIAGNVITDQPLPYQQAMDLMSKSLKGDWGRLVRAQA